MIDMSNDYCTDTLSSSYEEAFGSNIETDTESASIEILEKFFLMLNGTDDSYANLKDF